MTGLTSWAVVPDLERLRRMKNWDVRFEEGLSRPSVLEPARLIYEVRTLFAGSSEMARRCC